MFSALTHYCRKENNFKVYLSCTRNNFLNICNNCLLYSLYSELIPALIQFTQKQSWAILNKKLPLLKYNTFCSLIIIFFKGLVAVCHSFCIYLSLYNRYIHTSFIRKHHSLRFISISSQLSAQWVKPPWGPSRDLNSGLPYSKLARY